MAAQTRNAAESEAKVASARNRLVLEQAKAAGLLGAAKNTRLSGRVPSELVEAAKKRAHVTSDTELLELALSRLAIEDDFGARLVVRKGSIPAAIEPRNPRAAGGCGPPACCRRARDRGTAVSGYQRLPRCAAGTVPG